MAPRQQNIGLRGSESTFGHFSRRPTSRASWDHKNIDFGGFWGAKLGSKNVEVASKRLLEAETWNFLGVPTELKKMIEQKLIFGGILGR